MLSFFTTKFCCGWRYLCVCMRGAKKQTSRSPRWSEVLALHGYCRAQCWKSIGRLAGTVGATPLTCLPTIRHQPGHIYMILISSTIHTCMNIAAGGVVCDVESRSRQSRFSWKQFRGLAPRQATRNEKSTACAARVLHAMLLHPERARIRPSGRGGAEGRGGRAAVPSRKEAAAEEARVRALGFELWSKVCAGEDAWILDPPHKGRS